jgi:queuine tRNA-ribosyltransferase
VLNAQLGVGSAALAAILAYEALSEEKGALRPMRVVSRDGNLEALKLALGHKRLFEHLKHGAADTLVLRGKWVSRFKPGLSWELVREGDEWPAGHYCLASCGGAG